MSFSFSQHISGGYANSSPQGSVKNNVILTTSTSELIKHDVEMIQLGASLTGEQQSMILSDADFDMHSAPRSATTTGPEKGSATWPNARSVIVSNFPQNDRI
ncbi:hypothetical protein Hypma_001574 [Hypsizygus marmoreus]|uniref:Uncharacterized protein n=1 Tax=Hypsizygus marmoreus TaxID=39966 RepID=A0A369K0S5_HYPMA|nr:hypothetical protein Hypma_001574 [Hypsizygus marmoreus]